MTNNITPYIPEEIKIQMQIQGYLDRAVDYYIFARKSIVLFLLDSLKDFLGVSPQSFRSQCHIQPTTEQYNS